MSNASTGTATGAAPTATAPTTGTATPPVNHTAFPDADLVSYELITAINAPATVTATLAGGATVVVPATAAVNDVVILNADGSVPASPAAGTNYFTAAQFAAGFSVQS